MSSVSRMQPAVAHAGYTTLLHGGTLDASPTLGLRGALMLTRLLISLVITLSLGATNASAQASPASQPPSIGAPDQGSEAHPTPAHTGWATLAKDTGHDFLAFPRRKSTWVLLGLGAAAALGTHPADDYVEDHIVGNDAVNNAFKLGKFVGSAQVQVGTAVGLWAVGRYVVAPATDGSQTNKISHLGFDLIRAQILSQALVYGMKHAARRDRPTGECCAFPSGHATTAFAAAAVLERHFGYRGSWPALLAASYVAASRLVDNRHFLSDVVFGAALGEAIGWTVVGRHGRPKIALQPIPVRGGMMVAFVRTGD